MITVIRGYSVLIWSIISSETKSLLWKLRYFKLGKHDFKGFLSGWLGSGRNGAKESSVTRFIPCKFSFLSLKHLPTNSFIPRYWTLSAQLVLNLIRFGQLIEICSKTWSVRLGHSSKLIISNCYRGWENKATKASSEISRVFLSVNRLRFYERFLSS